MNTFKVDNRAYLREKIHTIQEIVGLDQRVAYIRIAVIGLGYPLPSASYRGMHDEPKVGRGTPIRTAGGLLDLRANRSLARG